MNIQEELQKIYHKYGTSEKANYEIQLLFDNAIREAVKNQKGTYSPNDNNIGIPPQGDLND